MSDQALQIAKKGTGRLARLGNPIGQAPYP